MLLLTSTSDIIRIVTGSAVSTIGVHASWADNLSSAVTPGRTNTAITTATTTTVVASPAASTQRNVRTLAISNNHASSSTTIAVQHYDGTTSIDLFDCTLLAGESIDFDQDGEWTHRDSQGGPYSYAGPPVANLGITGAIAETIPREICPEVNTTVPTASGTLFMQAIYLKAGQLVSNITVSSATTAAGTPTAGRVGLYDGSRNLRATSADQTTTAWAANTVKTLAMTTPYRVPTSGLYYIGFYMTATTVITMKGGTAKTGGQLASAVPILHGTSSTGLTTTLPDPAAAITAGLVTIYAAVT
jgi:hypothetical protein